MSKSAGKLARRLLAVEEQRQVAGLQTRLRQAGDRQPSYRQQTDSIAIGSQLPAEEVLAYGDSLYLSPPQNTRYNVLCPRP